MPPAEGRPCRVAPVHIDVALSPGAEVAPPVVAIAVDVIRATTTIAYALAQGYREVVCCPGVEDARAAAQELGEAAVLAGEVDRLPPPGFALGNSPREFEEGLPLGDVLVLSTTNGTQAVCWAASAAGTWPSFSPRTPSPDRGVIPPNHTGLSCPHITRDVRPKRTKRPPGRTSRVKSQR